MDLISGLHWIIWDQHTSEVTLQRASIFHPVLLFYGLHITNYRSGIERASRAGDFVIVTCIVKSGAAAAAAGLEVAAAADGDGGREGARNAYHMAVTLKRSPSAVAAGHSCKSPSSSIPLFPLCDGGSAE